MYNAGPVFNGLKTPKTQSTPNNITLSYCHAHARRKFEQIEKAHKKSNHGGNKNSYSLAKQAMQFYAALYKIEREATDKQAPEDRLSDRIDRNITAKDGPCEYFHQQTSLKCIKETARMLKKCFQYIDDRAFIFVRQPSARANRAQRLWRA